MPAKNKEDLLRELIHKSWHRGCKETDILLGRFARNKIHEIKDSILPTYRKLIHESDWDIYAWLTQEADIPDEYKEIIDLIQKYHTAVNQH